MLYIEKKAPPREMMRKVSEIKSAPNWKTIKDGNTSAVRDAFNSLPKDTIRKSLPEEQHYLCAYCMRKIQNDGRFTSIEHWFPLSKDKERALDYGNMLAVCDGGENWKGSGQKVLCCDAYKADERKLSISPLNRQQMDKIAYSKDGFIKTEPNDEKMEDDIRDILRLNGLWKKGKFIADTSTELIKGRRDTYLNYEKFVRKLDRDIVHGTVYWKRIKWRPMFDKYVPAVCNRTSLFYVINKCPSDFFRQRQYQWFSCFALNDGYCLVSPVDIL